MNLKILGFPLTIEFTAWIMVGFVVLSQAGGGPQAFLGGLWWAAALFGSILVHELGHALMARRLGLGPCGIVLHGFGGLTLHAPLRNPRQGLLVSFAGPGAGLLLGVVSLVALVGGAFGGTTGSVLSDLAWINLFWSLFNLLPMRPLDGGNLLQHLLAAVGVAPARVERTVQVLSLVLAALTLVGAIYMRRWFLIYLGILVIERNLGGGFGWLRGRR